MVFFDLFLTWSRSSRTDSTDQLCHHLIRWISGVKMLIQKSTSSLASRKIRCVSCIHIINSGISILIEIMNYVPDLLPFEWVIFNTSIQVVKSWSKAKIRQGTRVRPVAWMQQLVSFVLLFSGWKKYLNLYFPIQFSLLACHMTVCRY